MYFWKGRVALYALLNAFGIGAGDEVIVPAFTCVVMPEAVLFSKAKPVYVDIARDTLNLDPDKVRAAITPRTRAVIVQHTFGLAADLKAVQAVTQRYGIRIIEDCAHTMSTLYQGVPVGTMSDGAFYSTQWTKPITTGMGGLALARNSEIRARLRRFAQQCTRPSRREAATLRLQVAIHRALFRPALYWISRDVLRLLSNAGLFLASSTEQELKGYKPAGYEKTMAPFQERRLKKNLHTLDAYARHRVWVQERYAVELPRLGFSKFTALPNTQPVMLRYPIAVANKAEVLREAKRSRVEIGDWFLSPVHPTTDRDAMRTVGYEAGSCPAAEWAAAHVINLPTHRDVTASVIARTCEFLASSAVPLQISRSDLGRSEPSTAQQAA